MHQEVSDEMMEHLLPGYCLAKNPTDIPVGGLGRLSLTQLGARRSAEEPRICFSFCSLLLAFLSPLTGHLGLFKHQKTSVPPIDLYAVH